MAEDGFQLRDRYFDPSITPPLLVLEWNDPKSEATGYLAINSLRGGAAGGGTRIRHYGCNQAARDAAITLAKTMELKFQVSGPPIGGGKTVINMATPATGDLKAARRAVLSRWFAAIAPLLKTNYGTGGDENTSDVEIIELVQRIGIADPREGVIRGHYGNDTATRLRNVNSGVLLPANGIQFANQTCRISEVATGYGVAFSVRHYYERLGIDIRGKRVLIEGFGNVGAATAYFLDELGAKVVGISTLSPYLGGASRRIVTAARSALNVQSLISSRVGTSLGQGVDVADDDLEFWRIPADVFVPAGTSETITKVRMDILDGGGVALIAPGANNPFEGPECERSADSSFSVLPDYVTNCGMARAYSYFMNRNQSLGLNEWPQLRAAIESTISNSMNALEPFDRPGLLDRAYRHFFHAVADQLAQRLE